MPFINAPWSLDGTLIPSSLSRLANYAATSGSEGIIQLGDLKVAPLSTPGNGIEIWSGGAVVLNRYQGETPDQSYVVNNPGGEILGPEDMPPSVAAARSHLVCVTVGDPEFSAAGHPWMLGTDPPVGQEDTFEYVRPFVIQNVPAGTTSFDALNLNYPGLALARLDMPASTTTVQSSHIVDLRKMARPREKTVQWHVAVSNADALNGVADLWEYWPDNSQSLIDIPKWASYVYVNGYVSGARAVMGAAGTIISGVRVGADGLGIACTESHVHEPFDAAGARRTEINIGGPIYIPVAARGSSHNFQIQGRRRAVHSAGGSLTTDEWTSAQVTLRFVEVPD